MSAPTCPSCGNKCDPVDGRTIHPHRDDLNNKQFWLCEPCNAYCGREGDKATGSPATGPLRDLRRELMNELKILTMAKYDIMKKFDNSSARIVKAKAQKSGLRWLKQLVDIPYGGIGYMDAASATKALDIVKPYSDKIYAKRFPHSEIAKRIRQAK